MHNRDFELTTATRRILCVAVYFSHDLTPLNRTSFPLSFICGQVYRHMLRSSVKMEMERGHRWADCFLLVRSIQRHCAFGRFTFHSVLRIDDRHIIHSSDGGGSHVISPVRDLVPEHEAQNCCAVLGPFLCPAFA